jgi:hypothetical protein
VHGGRVVRRIGLPMAYADGARPVAVARGTGDQVARFTRTWPWSIVRPGQRRKIHRTIRCVLEHGYHSTGAKPPLPCAPAVLHTMLAEATRRTVGVGPWRETRAL